MVTFQEIWHRFSEGKGLHLSMERSTENVSGTFCGRKEIFNMYCATLLNKAIEV